MSWKGHFIRFYKRQPQHYNFQVATEGSKVISWYIQQCSHAFSVKWYVSTGQMRMPFQVQALLLTDFKNSWPVLNMDTAQCDFMSWNGHFICFYKQQSQHHCVLSNFKLRRKPKSCGSGRSNNEPTYLKTGQMRMSFQVHTAKLQNLLSKRYSAGVLYSQYHRCKFISFRTGCRRDILVCAKRW